MNSHWVGYEAPAYMAGYGDGRKETLREVRELINDELLGSKTLFMDTPGLRKALLIISEVEAEK